MRFTSRGEWVARTITTSVRVVGTARTPPYIAHRNASMAQRPRETPEQPEQTEPFPGPDNDSRWHNFRRLCLAYAECVRLEERGSIQNYADREGVEFIVVDVPLNWRAISGGTPVSVPARPEWRGFLDRTAARHENLDLMLGAPVDLFIRKDKKSGDEYRIVSPAFVTRVVARLVDRNLELSASGRIEVNHGWVSRRIRREQEQREFLETMGLVAAARQDQDSDEYLGVDSFEEAVRRLFEQRKRWWREYAQLGRPNREPGFADLDHSGLYNRVLLVEPPKLKYGARLHRELLRIAQKTPDEELDRSALQHVFPYESPEDSDPAPANATELAAPPNVAEYVLLSADQREACMAALEKPLTVVTGPPGTGKSLVVAHVLLNLALRGDAALFASRNHQALEAVEPRLNALTEPRPMLLRPTRPFGQTAAKVDWFRMMTELLAKPEVPGAEERLTRCREEVDQLLSTRGAVEDTMQRLSSLRIQVNAAQEEIRRSSERCPAGWEPHARSNWDVMKLHAPTQIGSMIDRVKSLHDEPKVWTARLWWRLTSRLRARRLRKEITAWVSQPSLSALEIESRINGDPIMDRERTLRVLGDVLSFCELVRAFAAERALQLQIEDITSVDELGQQLSAIKKRLHDATRDALNALAAVAGTGLDPEWRAKFAQLRAGLKIRPHEMEQAPEISPFVRAFREAAPELMRHYPLWAVSNLSVGGALPLKGGLFELVVIDEASQCDIPSIVPLLFRAKRAMVVGDPNQLSHVTQLPRDTEMRVRETFAVHDHALDRFAYGANSAYDLAAYGAERCAVTLRNHYRCVAPIIEYSNNAFYSGTLIVRTDEDALRQRLAQAESGDAGVVWTHLYEDIQPAARGCHSPNQVVAVETELRRLQDIGFPGSVGIVTPFRAQADRIRDRCHEVFDRACRQRWRLIVDTVDGFQGDERDLVLMSLVGGFHMPEGSKRFLASNPNRFNVAVSRARALLHVLGDQQWALNSQIPFVASLAQAAESPDLGVEPRRSDLIGPVWEPRLASALRRAGLPFDQQYPTCGYYLDFALFANEVKLCVEVDGDAYHRDSSGDRLLDDLYRDTILTAAGWEVIRFWVYELREDMEACVGRIQRALDRR